MIPSVLAMLVAVAAVLWQLAEANRARAVRHRQQWAPVLALLVTAVVLYAILRAGGPLGREWARLVRLADVQLDRTGIRLRTGPTISLAVNLGLLGGWLLLKRVVNTLLALLERWLRGYGLFPAYEEHPEQGVVLKQEWIYPGMLFRAAGWAVAALFLPLMVVSAMVAEIPLIALPHFPALAAILLLEVGWYLDGTLPVERPGSVGGRGVAMGKGGDYTPLWEEYQRVWPEHVLAASADVRLAPTPAAAVARPRLPDEGDETQQAVTGAWHDLVAAGHPLSDAHYHVLEQLWRGRDVLLTEADYGGVGPVLFAFLNRVLVDGHTVLVLLPGERRADPQACDEVEGWMREGLHGAAGGGAAWSLADFDAFQQRSAIPDVLIAAPEELLGRGVTQDPWFLRLHAVVLLEGARTVFEAPLRTDALMRVLRHRRPGLQQVVLSGERAALESALRDNLAGNPGEHRPPRPAPESAFAVVWSLESLPPSTSDGRFQDRVLLGSAGADLGAEAVLALPAWRDHVQPIHLVDQEGLPWAEYVEELENHRAGLMQPVPASSLTGTTYETVQVPALPQLLPRRDRAFVLARDRDHNLVAALRTWLPLGAESAFVHVVSPPYLLRDYLAANLEYFAQAPLLALSPRIADSRLVVALTLMERLTTGTLTEHEVLSELRAVLPGAMHVEESLARLFRDVLDVDPVEMNLLAIQRRTRYDEKQDAFVDEVAYRLSPEIREYEALAWLRRYRIVDRGEHVLGWIEQDRLYQTYLPGQAHAFRGKPFKVEWVDAASGIVWVDHETADEYAVYRPARMVDLEEVRQSEQRAHHERRTTGGWEMDAALCRGTFRVRTPGYYTFGRDLRLAEGGAAFTELDPGQVPERAYGDGRMLRLRFTPLGPLNARGRDRLADTLAVLFQEAFRTLYPETHGFLLACAPGSAERWAGNAMQALVPLMGPDPDPPAAAPAGGEARGAPIVLYFLEDAHAPLGLVLSLFDRRAEMMALLEDYLAWVLEDEGRTEESWRRPALERDRYLRYGGEAVLAGLDLRNGHAVLHSLLQGRNPRREERRAFFRGERRGAEAGSGGTRMCDFCGRMLPEAEFDRLEDGRERCAQCRATAVDTVPALKKVYAEARQFLVHHLGEKIRKDVEVQFGGAAQVQEAAGRPFMPTAEFDMRSTGIARREGNDFAILVENGQPYHTTLAVIVHELTHIWQFSYLDYERMTEEHGLLLTEGHAQWAALQCLRRRGLAPEWVAAEEARADVYGHGYRMIQEYERRYASHGDVFDILLHLYPLK
jgi:hypothetical protein